MKENDTSTWPPNQKVTHLKLVSFLLRVVLLLRDLNDIISLILMAIGLCSVMITSTSLPTILKTPSNSAEPASSTASAVVEMNTRLPNNFRILCRKVNISPLISCSRSLCDQSNDLIVSNHDTSSLICNKTNERARFEADFTPCIEIGWRLKQEDLQNIIKFNICVNSN